MDAATGTQQWPDPTGLFLGLLSVGIGQILVLLYHATQSLYSRLPDMQQKKDKAVSKQSIKSSDLAAEIFEHLSQPEGFALLGGYLCSTWMLRIMPASYYSLEGTVCVWHVILQLLLVDFLQYVMHRLEHVCVQYWPAVYQASHKPHHRFTSPKLTDAFHGSAADTVLMILVPLYFTSVISGLVKCNVWSYMAFGTSYANQLCLIHCQYENPWDPVFRALGIGTSADHHVHHKLYKYNYGHIFMYWDWIFGTYKSPKTVATFSITEKRTDKQRLSVH